MKCGVTLKLDFDSLYCMLDAGHVGYHWDEGEGGGFHWNPADPPLSGEGVVHQSSEPLETICDCVTIIACWCDGVTECPPCASSGNRPHVCATAEERATYESGDRGSGV